MYPSACAEDSADWSVVAGRLARLVAFGSPSCTRLAQSYSNRASARVVCCALAWICATVVCVLVYASLPREIYHVARLRRLVRYIDWQMRDTYKNLKVKHATKYHFELLWLSNFLILGYRFLAVSNALWSLLMHCWIINYSSEHAGWSTCNRIHVIVHCFELSCETVTRLNATRWNCRRNSQPSLDILCINAWRYARANEKSDNGGSFSIGKNIVATEREKGYLTSPNRTRREQVSERVSFQKTIARFEWFIRVLTIADDRVCISWHSKGYRILKLAASRDSDIKTLVICACMTILLNGRCARRER